MAAITQCRTAALGGHTEKCDSCGHLRIAYNSCANRHCPKCQSLARARWIENRQDELLAYYVVDHIYAGNPHVRFCGGADPVTGRPTRSSE